jgi:hypothetical protein
VPIRTLNEGTNRENIIAVEIAVLRELDSSFDLKRIV